MAQHQGTIYVSSMLLRQFYNKWSLSSCTYVKIHLGYVKFEEVAKWMNK